MIRQATRSRPDSKLIKLGYDYGHEVRINDTDSRTAYFTGKFGVIEEHNDGEIGVRVKGVTGLVWFRPTELELTL